MVILSPSLHSLPASSPLLHKIHTVPPLSFTWLYFSDLSLYSSRKAALDSLKFDQVPLLCSPTYCALPLSYYHSEFWLYSLSLSVGSKFDKIRNQNVLIPHLPSPPICIPVHNTVSSRVHAPPIPPPKKKKVINQ